MARSDSFFIRATVLTDTTNFNQASIDLGSFVDALGKTVMRIHSASISYGSPLDVPAVGVGTGARVGFQLTTQSQTDLVSASNRAVISSGSLYTASNAGGDTTAISETLDVAPQYWNNGYLVAVESIFLGVDQAAVDIVDEVTIVLECTVETMTAAASMALALSQQ